MPGTFEGLYGYESGKKINYSVTEDKVVGYSTEITGDAEKGFVIINSRRPDPVVPVDPPKPIEPSEPTDPPGPTEPSEPTGPSEPTDPLEPVEPSVPGDTPEPVIDDGGSAPVSQRDDKGAGVPKTGDQAEPWLWIIAGAAAAGTGLLMTKGRRSEGSKRK